MGTTTTWGLPYPEPTDRVMDGDQALQDLAEGVDADLTTVKNQATAAQNTANTANTTANGARDKLAGVGAAGITRGTVGVAFNASGYGTIAHGLGIKPVTVIFTPASHNGDGSTYVWDGPASDATNIRVYGLTGGNAAITSQTRTVGWVAFA